MRNRARRAPGGFRAIVYAVLVHAAIVAVLVIGFRWSDSPPGLVPGKPIEAVVAEDPRLKKLEEEKRSAEAQRQRDAEERRRAEAERKRQEAEAAKQREEEERQARAEEQRRLEAERKKADAEKQRQAELKRKQDEEARKKREEEERRRVEEQRRVEEERKQAEAEKQRQAELKRKQEEEARRKREEEERRRKAAEEQLRQQLAAEEKARIEAARAARAASEADKYRALIRQKVSRYWNRPPATSTGLRCSVRVRLVPGGEVLEANVVRSSGNPVFDRSVEAAVHRASPLPIPPDPDLFEYFREIEFLFNPEG